MTKSTTRKNELIKPVDLKEALSTRYLSYALSTITARSLPDVRDGLKPVHRRILYAMYSTGNTADKQHRKCANAVGYVMMHFHPHGDGAIYDSLVRMAQPFVMRMPLIDGQGNFGSIDGDNAAAMRYTECRLTKAGAALMTGIEENAVDFADNYNGQMREPRVLPSAYPNLLVNGAMGIAVGMATNVPPHNLSEVCKALRHLIKHPDASIRTLMKYISGPDFPTGGRIVEPFESLLETYSSGRGSIRLRAHWEVEELKNGTYQIVISEIPYQVQKSRLIEKMADLLLEKKLPLLQDLRDESAADVRIILVPKNRSVDPIVLMESLFKLTELEVKFSVNMNVLNAQGAPEIMDLASILRAFLDHRHLVFFRRCEFKLAKINERLEVLNGFLIVYLNLDEVIRIIRYEDEPAQALMKRFSLSEIQVEAILNMRLRALRKLEQLKIETEIQELTAEKKNLEHYLSHEDARWTAIDQELEETTKTFGSPRRTLFEDAPNVADIPLDTMIEKEAVTVVVSEQGWVKTMKGSSADLEIKYRDGDTGRYVLPCYTTDKLLILTNVGRFYTLGVDKLPGGRGFGEPLRVMLELSPDIHIVDVFTHSPLQPIKRLLVSSDARGFIVEENELIAQTKQGKQILNLNEGAKALAAKPIDGDLVAILGENRKLLLFSVAEIPQMSKGKGVLLQKYQGCNVADVAITTLERGLACLKNTPSAQTNLKLWIGKRGQSGKTPPAGFPKANRF